MGVPEPGILSAIRWSRAIIHALDQSSPPPDPDLRRRAAAKQPLAAPSLEDEQTSSSLFEVGLDAAPPPMAAPGQTLAGRFRIVRFIAQGGMGCVFEAEDLVLHERVALKTVRPEHANSEAAMERFRREIQLARKVTHPNVCRTFEIGSHVEGSMVTFVTMELLAGETLAHRLKRKGRMSLAQAQPIAEQMASALAAAHAAGVVHRDFKSSNVMLVPAEGGDRAVITDFGMARDTVADEASLTRSGAIVGTLAYMAPEQLNGAEATPASDVYSLGIVMYEMAIGVRPFPGSSISDVMQRVHQRPPSPRTLVADLDPRWEAIILRCLEPVPARRYPSARDVRAALRGEPSAPPARVRRTLWQAGLAALAVAALAALGVAVWPPAPSSPSAGAASPAAVRSRRAVAVLGFENLSRRSDAAWLSTALAEMLSAELAGAHELRTVPGESVTRMKLDLSLPDAGSFAPETLRRVRSNLAADVVVLGSYLALPRDAGGQIRLDLRIQDADAGETVATITETATEDTLLELVAKAGAQLRQRLGVTTRADGPSLAATQPSTTEAARLYGQGLARLRAFDTLAARLLLEKAVAADPAFPLGHAALAEAWDRLGYDAKARSAAKQAYELSASLPREERHVVEGRYREATREWAKAMETYQALVSFVPDNIEYGLRLAAAQTAGGHGKLALATLDALRKLPAPGRDDPRTDLAEAEAASSFGDYARSLAAARRAASKGSAVGARLLVARARAAEAEALRKQGEYAKALTAAEAARRLYSETGDRGGLASALIQVAHITRSQGGDVGEARRLHAEALAISRSTGDQRGVARALNALASVHAVQGELSSARSIWRKTLALHREVGDRQMEAFQLANLGGVEYEMGHLDAARAAYEQSLAVCRDIGEVTLPRAILYGLGNVWASQGKLAEARARYEEALEIARRASEERYTAIALSGLGDLDRAAGDLVGSRRHHEEALAISQEIGEKLTLGQSQVAMALLASEEGHHAAAETSARNAVGVFAQLGAAHRELWARATLARALMEQGKRAEAAEALPQAAAPVRAIENAHLRLFVTAQQARLFATRGLADQAVRNLEGGLAEARRLGLLATELEIRLARGEVLKASDPIAARAALSSLRKDADAAGFRQLAKKAEAAAK